MNIAQADIAAEPTWKDVLSEERNKPYFKAILAKIEADRRSGKIIYPPNSDIFNALAHTPFADVKVVIIGQDPYHGPGQAHGLCFSVREGLPFPPSLENIFKELKSDLQTERPSSGCLDRWARQGVLLLNAVLTVEANRPQSHQNLGWEQFTDRVISELNQKKSGLVFLLWGSAAQKKGAAIDRNRHTVLTAPHPSPLSAHRGFLGCKHFSKANQILKSQGLSEILW